MAISCKSTAILNSCCVVVEAKKDDMGQGMAQELTRILSCDKIYSLVYYVVKQSHINNPRDRTRRDDSETQE